MTKQSPKQSPKPGELVLQPNGKGALRHGSEPGTNKGGTGAPPSKVREACRESFGKRIPILETIADNDEARDLDRIAAMAALGKYGGVDKLALTVDEQPEVEMTPERVAGLFEQIQRIKTVKQLEKLLVGAAKKQGGE